LSLRTLVRRRARRILGVDGRRRICGDADVTVEVTRTARKAVLIQPRRGLPAAGGQTDEMSDGPRRERGGLGRQRAAADLSAVAWPRFWIEAWWAVPDPLRPSWRLSAALASTGVRGEGGERPLRQADPRALRRPEEAACADDDRTREGLNLATVDPKRLIVAAELEGVDASVDP
jgi:hypothetical protein